MSDASTTATAATAATTTAATAAATASTAAPWHDGIDAALLGVAQNKGWKLDSPKEAFVTAAKAYQEAQSRLGIPAEELIRLPKPNAPEADVKAFLGRIGVPAEAKEYDLSGVKFADGTALDTGFADTMRAALHDARVPKDRAAGVVDRIVKFMEAGDTADKAEETAAVNAQMTALKTNWGTKYDLNLQLAKTALERLGAAARLDAAATQAAWDALSKVGGIGSAAAMEMLLTVATKMGEPAFIGGGGLPNQPLSQDAAKAEIDALKKDPQFRQRLLDGGREERRKWDNLHSIAYPRAA